MATPILPVAGSSSSDDDEEAEEKKMLMTKTNSSTRSKKKQKKSKKPKFSINTYKAGSAAHVLSIVSSLHGYREVSNISDTSSIFWVRNQTELLNRFVELKSRQYVSRIPGMMDLCKKADFAVILNEAKLNRPEAYDFWPKTWVTPNFPPKSAFKDKKSTFIYKPDEGAQGDGIVLMKSYADVTRKLSRMSTDESAVVYIHQI